MNNTEEVIHCKGDISMQDEYMDFINYVFGFNGASSDFYKLLPKLYKREYNPCASSYITLENGKIKAALGAFDIGLSVCGTSLVCRGIGNVAVHPFSRSKGYMKKLMVMSVEDMIAEGVDFSALGGRRQRYNYFSYEKGGVSYSFTVNSDNIRHKFGLDHNHRFELKAVKAEDSEALADIAALSEKCAYHAVRKERGFYDTLLSWKAVPYAAYENGVFAGYAVVKKETVTEIVTVDSSAFIDMIVSIYDKVANGGSISVILPSFCREYIEAIYNVCEGYSIGANEMYSVFNYERVCDAFMKLKTTYDKLPDGELVISIDGRAKKENLLFAVKDGVPSVTSTDKTAQFNLSHIEAENLFFSSLCPQRDTLPAFARLWFPLPIWIYSADIV